METSTPITARTKISRKIVAVSPIIQNEIEDNKDDKKAYSKRIRKPRKMYEFEDSRVNEKDSSVNEKDSSVNEKGMKEDQHEVSVDQHQQSVEGKECEMESLNDMVKQKRKRNKKPKLNSTNEYTGEVQPISKTNSESVEAGDADSDNSLLDRKLEQVCARPFSEATISVDPPEDTNASNSYNKLEKTLEEEKIAEATAGNTNNAVIDPDKKIKKRRGRPPKSDTITQRKQKDSASLTEANNDEIKISAKKKGRTRAQKYKEDISVVDTSVGNNSLVDTSTNSVDTSIETPRRGRKRKVLDYAAINSGSQEDSDIDKEETVIRDMPVSSRKKKHERSFSSKVNEEEISPKTKAPASQKKSEKKKGELKCPKCEEMFKNPSGLQKHAAINHQIWWTQENPEGDGTERSSLRLIFKHKKYLNCVKCDKRINHVSYYYHHIEWCGREDERYTCEVCGHRNLKSVWRQQHRLTCKSLSRLEAEPESDKEREEEKEDVDPNVPRKRKAAQKALSMVHNISKDVDKDDVGHEDRDDDPDVRIDNDSEEEEDDDDDGDDEIDEDESASDGEGDEPLGIDDDAEISYKSKRVASRLDRGARINCGTYSKYLDTYPMMLKYTEKKKTEKLFQDLIPGVKQWLQLNEQESMRYLPSRKHSVKFKTDYRKELISLRFPDSVNLNGFPMMFTGLCVWKIAWCPMPVCCKDDQYLAIVGKLDKSTPFSPSKQSGPGVIQLWNCGPLSVKRDVKNLPRLWYCVGHEFGLATGIKWCPSGCYKTNSEQDADESYPRLGLLAVSFTDGTVRIFSLPLLQDPVDSEVRIYKGAPVITLYLHHRIDDINVSCLCIDWQEDESNRKVIAGYSDGKVCLYDLNCTTKPLLLKSDPMDGKCILPFKTFQAHGKLVRTVCWLSGVKDIVATGCENFETYIWNLNNTNFPIFQDNGLFMVTCSTSSLWHPGVFLGSDDNYAIASNRSRYVEAGSFSYTILTLQRRSERCSFNFTSQLACVWEVTYSNWLGFVVACDDRGYIVGMPMHDSLLYSLDTKVYKYRQLLFKTEEKPCKKASKDNENIVNDCDSDQLNTNLQKNDQSENMLDTSCDITASANSVQTADKSKYASNDSDPGKTDGESGISEDACEIFHKFSEFFENPKSMRYDTENDQYRRETKRALKTIQFNPNHLQCTWMAFGGDSGLVRLANIVNSIPETGRSHLKT